MMFSLLLLHNTHIGNKEDDESAIIIIGITCTVPITTLVILSICKIAVDYLDYV